MGKSGKGIPLAFFLIFFFSLPCLHAESEYPLITNLNNTDTGFRQYTDDVQYSRRMLYTRPQETPAFFTGLLTVYRYVSGSGDNIFNLAARCNIPYSALTTLNRLDNPVLFDDGMVLLLPSCPGIFIPENPRTDFEKLLVSSRLSDRDTGAAAIYIVNERTKSPEKVFFYPGADFNSTERIFFLNPGFRYPLRSFRLTSAYGIRKSPITGNILKHQGIDMAAPAGTEVYAAADGIVTEIGNDSVYGNYIIIKHGDKWASLYGHLQKAETTLRAAVKSGTLIGRVGSTGMSTGPHLHFELRENGVAQDPTKLLFQSGN
ncbi:MAG: M23 family metallopeptidase [Treponema sp.]|nr:M23 family metallopeptidase [Treponema sp.]